MLKKSLSFKLNLTLVLVTATMLSAFALWNARTIHIQETERMALDTESILLRLNETLPAAMWNFATTPAEKAIQGELKHPAVDAIVVTDMDGKIFTQANKQQRDSLTIPDNALTKQTALSYLDGDTASDVGTVTLVLTQKPVQQAVRNALIASAIQILLLEILLSIALAFVLSRLVISPLTGILTHINDITKEHNLTKRIRHQGQDELGQLSHALNQFFDEIQNAVKSIHGATDNLLHIASGTRESHQSLENDMNQQQNAIDLLTAALQNIGTASDQLTSNSHETTQLISNAKQDTSQGAKQVQYALSSVKQFANDASKSTEAIDQLRQEVDAIAQVLDVIRGIAEQTNLLALNAAIEAARAGEQGRGFAVVADEVRALASRTQQSTHEISETLAKLMQRTEATVTAMRSGVAVTQQTIENATEAGESIQRVLHSIEEILSMSEQISAATTQQSRSLSETDHSVEDINQAVSHTLEQAHSTRQLNDKLLTTASTLNQLASKFKT